MSVLIKGMDMPKSCAFCPCRNGYMMCQALASDFHLIREGFDFAEERLPNCPLVEVETPHGRLVDADKLHHAMYHRAFETDGDTMWQSGCWVRYRAIDAVQDEQPTVIEAEE